MGIIEEKQNRPAQHIEIFKMNSSQTQAKYFKELWRKKGKKSSPTEKMRWEMKTKTLNKLSSL